MLPLCYRLVRCLSNSQASERAQRLTLILSPHSCAPTRLTASKFTHQTFPQFALSAVEGRSLRETACLVLIRVNLWLALLAPHARDVRFSWTRLISCALFRSVGEAMRLASQIP